MRVYSQLPNYEIYAYFIIWISGVSYSVYEVYLTGKLFSHYSASDDFTIGWTFLNRKKDVSDYEWKTWTSLHMTIAPWIGIHFLCAELIRWMKHWLLPYWYVVISVVFLVSFVGPLPTLFLVAQPCVFYLLLQSRSSACVWLASLLLLAALNIDQTMAVSGDPVVMWLSGLHIPESYLTALVQVACRKNAWPLDRSTLYTSVTQFTNPDEVEERPDQGCYVMGLYLEGGRWDIEGNCLRRSHPKVLIEELPILMVNPIEAHRLKLQNTLKTPVYTTSLRRNAMGVGLVFEADLGTTEHISHWVLQGVCLILNTD